MRHRGRGHPEHAALGIDRQIEYRPHAVFGIGGGNLRQLSALAHGIDLAFARAADQQLLARGVEGRAFEQQVLARQGIGEPGLTERLAVEVEVVDEIVPHLGIRDLGKARVIAEVVSVAGVLLIDQQGVGLALAVFARQGHRLVQLEGADVRAQRDAAVQRRKLGGHIAGLAVVGHELGQGLKIIHRGDLGLELLGRICRAGFLCRCGSRLGRLRMGQTERGGQQGGNEDRFHGNTLISGAAWTT